MARTVHTSLLIIGGAEDKVGHKTVLRRFVRLAGGSKARIVVIPTASSFPEDAVDTYTAIFSRLGAPEVEAVDPPSRQTAATEAPSARAGAAYLLPRSTGRLCGAPA